VWGSGLWEVSFYPPFQLTDIVGYSRLIPVDEVGTLARLETHYRIHGC